MPFINDQKNVQYQYSFINKKGESERVSIDMLIQQDLYNSGHSYVQKLIPENVYGGETKYRVSNLPHKKLALNPIEETMHTRRTTGTMQIEDEQMEKGAEIDQDDEDTRIVRSPE